jgi:dolichol kinase
MRTLHLQAYFNHLGNFDPALSLGGTALLVFLLSLAAGLVETVPLHDIDNITVPLAVIVLGHWLMPLATVPCD